MKEKLSIKDIAKIAGVSTATISRILNKNGRYSKETEKRVLKIIEESGYIRNVNAKSLRTQKTQTIGIIVPDITNEFFAKIIRSAEEQAILHDYSVFVCNTNEDEKREQLQIKNLLEKVIDGIIYISGRSTDNESISEINNIPTVYIDRYISTTDTYVESDNEMGGYLATKELLDCGCENILILYDKRKISTAIRRFDGYKKAHEESNRKIQNDLVCKMEQVTYEEARNIVSKKIKEGLKFDGVFATNDSMAIGALKAIKESHLDVPNDIQVVGFDNISITRMTYPSLTTIHQNTKKLGSNAVEILIKKIFNKKTEVESISIPVELIRRKSTKEIT